MNDDFRKAIARSQSISAQNQANAAANNLGSELSNIASKQKDNGNFFTNLIGGIGEKINDVGNTIGNVGRTLFGIDTDLLANDQRNAADNKARDARNEIAKKYGYSSYADAMNDDNFWSKAGDELKDINDTQKNGINLASDIAKAGDTNDINLNQAKGQALSTIGTIADFAPGLGVVGNVASGALEGIGDAYKTAAQQGTDINWNEAGARALAGAGSAVASGAIGSAVGKQAGKLVENGVGGIRGAVAKGLTGNTLTGAAARGAISGAAGGAASGGIMNAMTGQDALQGAIEGARSGAAGGALMGGGQAALAKMGNSLSSRIQDYAQNNSDSAMAGSIAGIVDNLTGTLSDRSQASTDSISDNSPKTRELSSRERMKLENKYNKAKAAQGEALLDQYGTLDKPTRRAIKDGGKVLSGLQDNMGITTPEELGYAHKNLTTGDGIISQITNEIAGTANDVDITFNRNDLKKMIAQANLGDIDTKDSSSAKGRTVMTTIENAIKSIPDASADGTTANGKDVLDAVRKLNAKAADLEGNDGRRYHNPSSEDLSQAKVLKDVARQLETRVNEGSINDISNIVTPERIQAMRDIFPNNETYQKWIDNNVANNKTSKQWRSSVKPLVDGGKIVEASNMSGGSFADKVKNGISAATSRNTLLAIGQIAAGKVADSETVSALRAKRAQSNANKYQAQLNGEAPVKSNAFGSIGNRLGGSNQIGGALTDFSNQMIDAGNRQEARGIAQNAINNVENQQLQNQAQSAMQNFANTYGSDTLQAALAGMQNQGAGGYDLANSLVGNIQAPTAAQTEYGQALAAAQDGAVSGNPMTAQLENQMQMLQNGMQNAMAAGDMTSYAKIMDLYNNAYKMYSTIQSAEAKNTTSSASKLSDTQKKALAARSQLAQLSSLNPTGRSMLPDWLRNLTGGDEYTSAASQLASTIGYMQSGANVSESEKAAIRTNYIPQATDSAEVRARKLQAAQQLLNDYLAGTEYAQ